MTANSNIENAALSMFRHVMNSQSIPEERKLETAISRAIYAAIKEYDRQQQ